jgi:hypothetical protein
MDQSFFRRNVGVSKVRVQFAVRNRTLCSSVVQTVERTDKDGATGVVTLHREVCEQGRRN